ncbi:MAG: YabP/YqfC family sporulation protein [Firmicutes bacterium]|nr:YabP/YqfC family sporulation protein [Bacillota bacterium]MCL2770706.1 YabP/YqfC family sporulation protein [Bacillota bacterium]
MLKFLDEFSKLSGLDEAFVFSSFRCLVVESKAYYAEGFLEVLCFSTEEIELKLKRGTAKVVGNNLSIQKLEPSLIVVVGDILKTEVKKPLKSKV